MDNSNSLNDVQLVISEIVNQQSKSFQMNLKDFLSLLGEEQLEVVVIKNVLSIYHSLETLHKENKINTQEFNQRITSLVNIVQLVEDVNATKKKLHTSKP